MQYESILELLQKGGFTIYVLAFCSIISLKVALEKLIQYQGFKKSINDWLINLVKDYSNAGQYEELLQQIQSKKFSWMGIKYYSPMVPVITYIVKHRQLEREELLEASFTKMDKELVNFERGLGIPATLGSITPFIGLFGTVIGIIKSFSALSLQDASNYASVISGIAEALIATAGGLFVAIPSVMFYNYFTKRLKMQLPLFDELIRDTVTYVKRK